MAFNRQRFAIKTGSLHAKACKVVGVTVAFSNRGAAPVTLSCLYLGDDIIPTEQNGIVTEIKTSKFEIGVQTGFAYSDSDIEPVTVGDKVTYNGKEYSVSQGGIHKDDIGSVYTLTCTESKRIGSGVG